MNPEQIKEEKKIDSPVEFYIKIKDLFNSDREVLGAEYISLIQSRDKDIRVDENKSILAMSEVHGNNRVIFAIKCRLVNLITDKTLTNKE